MIEIYNKMIEIYKKIRSIARSIILESIVKIIFKLPFRKKKKYYLTMDEFHKLQNQYSPKDDYKYDYNSFWQRGLKRSADIIKKIDQYSDLTPNRSMELGCGDGLTSLILLSYGYEAHLTDIDDWRNKRAKSLPFYKQKIEDGIRIDDNYFDLIFSYNAFEHFESPEKVLIEIIRLLSKGGIGIFEFGPLYNSPWGLHAYRTIYPPYSQFLFSEELINTVISQNGNVDLGKKMDNLQPLNKFSFKQFKDLFHSNNDIELLEFEAIGKSQEGLPLVVKYPLLFSSLDINYEELVNSTLFIVIKKK